MKLHWCFQTTIAEQWSDADHKFVIIALSTAAWLQAIVEILLSQSLAVAAC